ncbi:hypothetical protein BDR22DRAFT_71405 [Usnea florida]
MGGLNRSWNIEEGSREGFLGLCGGYYDTAINDVRTPSGKIVIYVISKQHSASPTIPRLTASPHPGSKPWKLHTVRSRRWARGKRSTGIAALRWISRKDVNVPWPCPFSLPLVLLSSATWKHHPKKFNPTHPSHPIPSSHPISSFQRWARRRGDGTIHPSHPFPQHQFTGIPIPCKKSTYIPIHPSIHPSIPHIPITPLSYSPEPPPVTSGVFHVSRYDRRFGEPR